MNFAPIGITTYSRIDHITKTVESLKNNALASESNLYIFLDGPKKGDEEKVEIVRQYAYTINGFKAVNVVERLENHGSDNGPLGLVELLEKYGKCIYMEDDNVVAPLFLQYMNDGLEFYKNDRRVFSISAFNIPSEIPVDYEYDCYLK